MVQDSLGLLNWYILNIPWYILQKTSRVVQDSLDWYILNIDGSVIGCPGLAGGGGLIWDHQGRWVKRFARAIGWSNGLEDELCINISKSRQLKSN